MPERTGPKPIGVSTPGEGGGQKPPKVEKKGGMGARDVTHKREAPSEAKGSKSKQPGEVFKSTVKPKETAADTLRREIAMLKIGIGKGKIGKGETVQAEGIRVEKGAGEIAVKQAKLDTFQTKEGILQRVAQLKAACAALKKSGNKADKQEANVLEKDLASIEKRVTERMDSPVYQKVEDLKRRFLHVKTEDELSQLTEDINLQLQEEPDEITKNDLMQLVDGIRMKSKELRQAKVAKGEVKVEKEHKADKTPMLKRLVQFISEGAGKLADYGIFKLMGTAPKASLEELQKQRADAVKEAKDKLLEFVSTVGEKYWERHKKDMPSRENLLSQIERLNPDASNLEEVRRCYQAVTQALKDAKLAEEDQDGYTWAVWELRQEYDDTLSSLMDIVKLDKQISERDNSRMLDELDVEEERMGPMPPLDQPDAEKSAGLLGKIPGVLRKAHSEVRRTIGRAIDAEDRSSSSSSSVSSSKPPPLTRRRSLGDIDEEVAGARDDATPGLRKAGQGIKGAAGAVHRSTRSGDVESSESEEEGPAAPPPPPSAASSSRGPGGPAPARPAAPAAGAKPVAKAAGPAPKEDPSKDKEFFAVLQSLRETIINAGFAEQGGLSYGFLGSLTSRRSKEEDIRADLQKIRNAVGNEPKIKGQFDLAAERFQERWGTPL